MTEAILLNGTIGVGKSEVGLRLNHLLSRSVLLEADALIKLNPHPHTDEERTMHLRGILPSLLRYWRSVGAEPFILDNIMRREETIRAVERIFEEERCVPVLFTLVAGPDEIRERVMKRNRFGKPEFEVEPALRLAAEIGSRSYLGTVVETNGLSAADVATKIIGLLKRPSSY